MDYKSAQSVIFNCKRLILLSTQCSVQSEYSNNEIDKIRKINSNYSNYIMTYIDEWLDYLKIVPYYGDNDSFINWDLCCAIYLSNPELFDKRFCRVVKDYKAME
ncbi:MAG: hypothetical protein JJE21_11140, partial [Spirochaetaceae bacterium]|nr:hypothetical protein [Spirochaetaceae bacterium]